MEDTGLAGSSLDRTYQNQIWKRLVAVMVVPLLLVQLAIYEWMKMILGEGSAPVALTLMAALAAGYAAFRVRPLERRLAASVGNPASAGWWRLEEILSGFEKRGARVLRDYPVPGSDPVPVMIASGSGVFAIWVDQPRAESNQSVEVSHRCVGEHEVVCVNGFEVFGDPLRCARAGAAQVRRIIQGGSNPDCYVQPVFVIPRGRIGEVPVGATVAVVDEAGLKHLVEAGGGVLDEAGVEAIVSGLKRRVRVVGG